MFRCRSWMIVAAALFACAARSGIGAEDGKGAGAAKKIVATIDGQPIYAAEVERELRAANLMDGAETPADPALFKHAAEQVVDRHLVLNYLLATKQIASAEDVEETFSKLKHELDVQKIPLAEHLRKTGWTEPELRRHLLWTLSWQHYLNTAVTDAALQKYFAAHRAEFDGTQLRVSHLLLKAPAGDAAAVEQAVAEAKQIRADIAAGKLSFVDAVKQHSQAPTAATGGDLGLIERRQPMPEAFSAAAFALKRGEISQPVVSPFGVHLIQCNEVVPGKLEWKLAEAELRPAVALYLFRCLAAKQRAVSTIEWR